jgi:phospholipid/cholesterol/gamma-HCH transport system substrate-binding protein
MTKEQFTELRAGIFTLVLSLGFAVMVFILGSQKGYFEPQITLKARFVNAFGLQAGAPVRFMGVGIGHIKAVVLPEKLPCAGVDVFMVVNKSAQKILTRDSVATIKWLSYVTGDSYVEITTGACREPSVQDGDTILSAEPVNYAAAIEGGVNIIGTFSKLLKKLDEGGIMESLGNISSSLNESLKVFRKGEGLLYTLIYDPQGKQILENLAETTTSLKKILEEIEKGDGSLHGLIYKKDVEGLIANLSPVAKQMEELMAAFKTEQGFLYALIFDPEKRKILDNFATFSNNLNDIAEKINRGEGTLGALIIDPAVYENLKKLLGGADRSFILRSLIRRSIEKGKEE